MQYTRWRCKNAAGSVKSRWYIQFRNLFALLADLPPHCLGRVYNSISNSDQREAIKNALWKKTLLFPCKNFTYKISKRQPTTEEVFSSEHFSKLYTAYVILLHIERKRGSPSLEWYRREYFTYFFWQFHQHIFAALHAHHRFLKIPLSNCLRKQQSMPTNC